MYSKETKQGIVVWKVSNNSKGEPRYVVHFMDFLSKNNQKVVDYELALSRAKTIGAKEYRAKWFGGGFVFVSWNLDQTIEKIKKLAGN